MKNTRNLANRYFWSIVIDYIVFIVLGVLTYQYFTKILILRGWIVYIYLLFILSEDKLFGNHSIGKMILGIRIYPKNKYNLLTWTNIILRRIYEPITPIYFLIKKRPFDINNKTESCIDFCNIRLYETNEDDSQNKINEIHLYTENKKLISVKRFKAYIIDFLFIFWALFILLAATLSWPSSIFSQISEVNRTFLVLGSTMIMILYAIFKDFIFGTQSIGKRIVGIEIINIDGSIPTTKTVLLRNIFWVFYSIETIVLLVNGKRIGELVSKTSVREKRAK